MSNERTKRIWDDLDRLEKRELLILVEAAVAVLQSGLEDEDSLHDMPSAPLISTLHETLLRENVEVEPSQILNLIDNNDVSLKLCKKLLKEISGLPELAKEIEDTYNTRTKMMSFDVESTLLAASLLVLSIKIKYVDLKSGKIKFYEFSNKAIKVLCEFLDSKIGG